MDRSEIEVLQARATRAQWWLRFTTVGWILSIAVLIVGWVVSMALLVTSSRLFEAVFALP